MLSLPVDHNKQTDSMPSPPINVAIVDDASDAMVRVIAVQKMDPIGIAGASDTLSSADLAEMFRTLEGYECQVDEQQRERLLGSGGFGKVYLATEGCLNRPVAIKVLKPEFRTDRTLVTLFLQEGKLTSQLQHPGIPPVHAMGLWNGCPAIVMKVVGGQTLWAYLKECRQRGSPPGTKVIDYFLQVCRAVAYAHANKTLHLDLKPGNVMIGAQDEIQVMDWGLARLVDKIDEPAAGLGTWQYMPPEQANEITHDIGPHSDVFSLGAMLTVILTGTPPYSAKSKGELITMARSADLADGFERLNDLEIADPSLATLTGLARWCLSKTPAMRPRDAGIVVEALMSYQEGLRQQVQKEISDRARREQQAIVARARFRARATILGAVAVIALIATAGGVWSVATARVRNAGFQTDLDKIDQLIHDGSDSAIDEARRDLAIVESRSADGSVFQAVRQSIDAAKADLAFIAKRNEARQSLAEYTNGLELNTGTALQYGTLFQQYGIVVKNTKDAAARIRGSRIQSELLAGLDHWSLVSDDILKPVLWQVAMEASKDGWCREFRTPQNRANPVALRSLVTRIPWAELSADEFDSTARGLAQQGLRAESLTVLRKAVQRFPNDFWLNLLLGQEIAAAAADGGAPATWQRTALEAVSYLRAALAIHENAHVYSEIARVSLAGDDLEAAEVAANQALKMDNNAVPARYYQAEVRLRQKKPREAASIARQALEKVKAQSPVQQSQWVRRLNELLTQAENDSAGK